MVRALPLRSGFFAAPQITPEEEAELLTWGRSLVADLQASEVEWTLVQDKKGLQICEDRQKGGLTYSIKATAAVKASLDDIMDMFIATSTVEYRSLMQVQLRELFCDSAVLFHREQNESESLGIKWFAIKNKKTAMNPMVVNQDLCVLEYTGVIGADAIGGDPDKPIGVCLYESIDQQECPSLWDSHKLERSSISKCGYLFVPREEGIVEAQFVCSIRQPPNQRSKRRLNRSVLNHWAESVGHIEESISRKRISRELTQRRCPTWVNDKDRQCCHLCLKTFTNMRRKHHCRACGEIICRNCSLYKSVDLQSVGLTTLRVCKSCMDGTNKETTASSSSTGNGTGSESFLPSGIDEERLRDAVEEYALALPQQQISSVPDLVGIAWLRQIAARDPSKREMVNDLMHQLRTEAHEQYSNVTDDQGAQVDIYDTLCDLAAQTLSCKYAVVSLIDENRQWFKSAVNVSESDVPRDFSFCEYPVRDQRPLVVMDTLRDARFMHHPFVTGPLAVRFLAGAPLFTVDSECVGAVCVLDTEPRHTLQESQIATMQNLAHLAMVMVQERREALNKLPGAGGQLVAHGQPQQYGHGGGYGQYSQPPPHHHHQYQQHQQQYYAPPPPPHSGNYSSDLVPLSSYSGESTTLVVQASKPAAPTEDSALKEQMIQLLHKASQVRDQVNQQSMQQHPGLQSAAE
ncbi:TPA: hypothetical protein N0F65_011491 [Lagenidium giganteum]|uniref:FYVE-type domain-containing protein n=1 Tax=Lagenidium giganteum TaxID=4803 RepID=A0AAV2YI58_9STRA|nr:TPA: hypothetical protein N0F65_011491 [Lagenidium giganteum]